MKKDYSTRIGLELDALIETFNNLSNHRTGDTAEVFPFIASKDSPKIKGRFNQSIGDLVRNISSLKFENQKVYDQFEKDHTDELCDLIVEDIEFEHPEDKDNFVRFVKSFLFNEGAINPIHPYLYNFITSEKKYKGEMNKYGNFLFDVFINSDNQLKAIFNNKESDDILTEIILSKMDSMKLVNKEYKNEYQNVLPIIGKLYRDDMLYLSNYDNYFLTSFPVITQFYAFMYTSQLILKFEQFDSADYETLELFYFALDWESVSGRREAASGPGSFKLIKEMSANLFPHVHAMSHLSHNTANVKTDNVYQFMTYPELMKVASLNGSKSEEHFLGSINKWITHYSKLDWIPNKVTVISENTSLEKAFRELQEALKQGMSKQSRERYGAHVQHLGANYFIKSRGSLGFVFNLTHDFILMLTAVSVKEERIPLSKLFDEYEKRGITLDWRSKKEVIQFLDNLNFIDKKSDSGDAQYVKPIL